MYIVYAHIKFSINSNIQEVYFVDQGSAKSYFIRLGIA